MNPEVIKPTVLVIDDSEYSHFIISEVLSADYRVISAHTGAEGLRMAEEYQPELILLDVVMPGMSGFDVFQDLRSTHATAGIKVVFLTGLNSPEDEARALILGASDFITKPFNIQVLYARVATHIRQSQALIQMEKNASLDGLTGIPNRRKFDEAFYSEFERARRANLDLSVALIDIDFFKQYNDHYGHIEGDKTLKWVAQVVQSFARRPGDLAARYGGEEFALILPNLDNTHVHSIGDMLCRAVENLKIEHHYSGIGEVLTVSVGFSSCQWNTQADLTGLQLIEKADERLYQAKAAGRNRAISA
ncbi:diguanylate cyclase [Xylophilus sp. Kf1]|nr:diguanylate cyclase [Xylophilus sp. Kf1]